MSLARQMDVVFRQLRGELSHLSSGIIFVQIRNNTVGKFGVRHHPIEAKNGEVIGNRSGLSEQQQIAFRNMAIQALQWKNWTHGEIEFDFAIRQNLLVTSVQFESNYNMAALVPSLRNVQ